MEKEVEAVEVSWGDGGDSVDFLRKSFSKIRFLPPASFFDMVGAKKQRSRGGAGVLYFRKNGSWVRRQEHTGVSQQPPLGADGAGLCQSEEKQYGHFGEFSFATNSQPPTGLSTGLGSDSFADTQHNGREGDISICNQSQS